MADPTREEVERVVKKITIARIIECHRCDGYGFIPIGEGIKWTCPDCNGKAVRSHFSRAVAAKLRGEGW